MTVMFLHAFILLLRISSQRQHACSQLYPNVDNNGMELPHLDISKTSLSFFPLVLIVFISHYQIVWRKLVYEKHVG